MTGSQKTAHAFLRKTRRGGVALLSNSRWRAGRVSMGAKCNMLVHWVHVEQPRAVELTACLITVSWFWHVKQNLIKKLSFNQYDKLVRECTNLCASQVRKRYIVKSGEQQEDL